MVNLFLHPCEINSKGVDKIKYFVAKVILNWRKYYYPGTNVSINKRMISCRGKNEFINPQNPTKYGFSPYELTNSKSRYTFTMKLLENPDDNENGKIYGVVIELMEKFKGMNQKKYYIF